MSKLVDGSYQYRTFYATVNISSEVLIFLWQAKVDGLQDGAMKLLQGLKCVMTQKSANYYNNHWKVHFLYFCLLAYL
jgi:hypothetical protein